MGRLKGAITLIACVFLVCSLNGKVRAQSTDVDSEFANAIRLHQAGDIDGAVRAYQQILAKQPNRADVRSNLGAAYSRLGRYQDAIDQYKRALTLDSHNDLIRFNLALAYYKAAWFAEAAHELTTYIAALPEAEPRR